MLVQGIKSRPTYTVLAPDPQARRHLIAAEGEGALAVLDFAAALTPEALVHVTILYAGHGHAARLEALGADSCHVFPTVPTLLVRLGIMLGVASMGTRLYAAGTEGFIAQIVQAALGHGIDHHSIVTEHRGSLARRVQCVHCKGITENVTTNIATCSHCGVHLLVRDHFSRRLGAFMGVSADAEAPGELPPLEEIFR